MHAAGQHEVAILEDGLEWEATGVPPEEAQFLATREFNVEDVCRWFRFPPAKAMSMRGAPRANVEQQNLNYATDTLMPWAVRWEQEAKRKLFPGEEGVLAELQLQGLMRGDMKTRGDYYTKRFTIGTLNQNEIREFENENPAGPEGEVYYVPSSLTPAHLAAKGQVSSGKAMGKGPRPEKEKEGTVGVRAEVLMGHARAILVEALARVTAKEVQAARRAAGKHELSFRGADGGSGDAEAFEAWAARFYEEHVGYVTKGLMRPAMMVAGIVGGTHAEDRAEGVARAMAMQELRLAQAALVGAFKSHSVQEWSEAREERIEAVADAIMQQVHTALNTEV